MLLTFGVNTEVGGWRSSEKKAALLRLNAHLIQLAEDFLILICYILQAQLFTKMVIQTRGLIHNSGE